MQGRKLVRAILDGVLAAGEGMARHRNEPLAVVNLKAAFPSPDLRQRTERENAGSVFCFALETCLLFFSCAETNLAASRPELPEYFALRVEAR